MAAAVRADVGFMIREDDDEERERLWDDEEDEKDEDVVGTAVVEFLVERFVRVELIFRISSSSLDS